MQPAASAGQGRGTKCLLRPKPSRAFPVGLLFWFCLTCAIPASAQPQPLTNAAQILSLSPSQAAQRLPVRVKGIVTAAEPGWVGTGKFFMQDETSGVFVGKSDCHVEPGDVVEVTGVAHPGSYAPAITSPKCQKIGKAPLPEPREASIEQVMSGVEDGQRVEIAGIVRSVVAGKTNLDVEVASGGYRLHAFPRTSDDLDPTTLVGAKVRIRGTAAASFNAELRHMLSVVLFVPQREDFVVEQTESTDPFKEPLSNLTRIAQYRRDLAPGTRVHVKGIVTFYRPGEELFLEDETGGLHVRTRQADALSPGEVVEAVGFPGFDNFLPVLEDAVFKRTGEAARAVKPKRVTISEIIERGLHHADLITLRGRVLDRSFRRDGKRLTRTVLMLQQDNQYNLVFAAEAATTNRNTALAEVPVGSTIEVTGVCFTENGEDKKLKSLQVLLPDAASFRILASPSWLTPGRLLIGLAAVLMVAVVAVVWTVMVSRRNAILSELVREKEKAQTELQEAHDLLEERVKERTAQLKFQITARKESELQFKAVLSERTRLAQELHDTLEQTLTGVALQLDATSKLFQAKPESATHHLELARDLVSQGQVDVHRSVWDLRSRALEEFDLPGALLATSKKLSDGTSTQFEIRATGRVRPLPETIEDNLLRIAQEAMTNIIKHAQATLAEIELDYGPQNVLLRVKDNGVGFDQNQKTGHQNGHFGLLGITERAKRLGASLKIESEPGAGTLVTVQVGIEQSQPETIAVAQNGK